MEKVFVYGTLKRGYSNNYLLQSSECLGHATTKDRYAMYSSGIPYVTEQLYLCYSQTGTRDVLGLPV